MYAQMTPPLWNVLKRPVPLPRAPLQFLCHQWCGRFREKRGLFRCGPEVVEKFLQEGPPDPTFRGATKMAAFQPASRPFERAPPPFPPTVCFYSAGLLLQYVNKPIKTIGFYCITCDQLPCMEPSAGLLKVLLWSMGFLPGVCVDGGCRSRQTGKTALHGSPAAPAPQPLVAPEGSALPGPLPGHMSLGRRPSPSSAFPGAG